jgi:hypothetical protein
LYGNGGCSYSKLNFVGRIYKKWEDYFFNSYFSHLMNEHNPINGNCVNLWKSLINTEKQFPKETLKKQTEL